MDTVSKNLELTSNSGGAEGELLFSDESGDESRLTSVSEKKSLVTGLIKSIQYTVSSEVFESELSILKNF